MFVTWKRLHVFIGIPILFVAQMQTNICVKSIQNNKSIIIHMNTRNLFQVRNTVYHVILTLAGPCIIIQSK
jgi:ABC-type polysaccharide/polyol phosphate export permease